MTVDSFIAGFDKFRLRDGTLSSWWLERIPLAKKCYFNNISFFETIDKKTFLLELDRIVKKYGFKRVGTIPTTKNCLYIMVLGKYNQFYVGKSVSSVNARIKKHWRSNMRDYISIAYLEVDRLPIDAFKMFDTTEVYVLEDFEKVKTDPNFKTISKYELEHNQSNCHKTKPELDELSLVERTVINECNLCCSLNDRTPILSYDNYKKLETYFGKKRVELKIKDFNDYSFNNNIYR